MMALDSTSASGQSVSNGMRAQIKRVVRWAGTRCVPPRLKGLLFRGAFSIMAEEQRDQSRLTFQIASLERSLRSIKALGFSPARIVDVGAYAGEWTRMVKEIFPEASVLMVEAQRGRESQLKRVCELYGGEVSYRMSLLGAEEREQVTFHELEPGAETGSSVLAARSNLKSTEIAYPMTTLDALLAEAGWDGVDFLKLDVQGYELEILKGAGKTLRGVEVILMEVSLLGVYEEAPLLHDVTRFMAEQGFRAYDICSFIRRPLDNALWQSDFIFVSESSQLLANQSFH